MSKLGELNFLMSDGVHLLVFANKRLDHDLHQVSRACVECDCEQQVIMLATTPLTEEDWHPLERDRLYIFSNGQEASA